LQRLSTALCSGRAPRPVLCERQARSFEQGWLPCARSLAINDLCGLERFHIGRKQKPL
jgi:hypothetical protein